MTTGREPLTQEERALAARLARLGVPDGPPPALDAKILAAAHNATLRTQAAAPRRRRWPVAIGAAASVVVALGIAWQLRPAQDSEQAYSESDFVRAPRASGPSAAEELPVAGVVAADQAQAAPPQPASVEAAGAGAEAATQAAASNVEAIAAVQSSQAAQERADAAAEDAARTPDRDAFPAEARKQAAPPAPPAPPPPPPEQAREEQIVFDAPSPVAAPAPAPSAAPAREAAATQQRRQTADTAATAQSAPAAAVTVTGSRIARDNEGFSDEELDHQPPATADSTQVQRAWLLRIREMLADGDMEGAKASLTEFKRRNPHYALPEDLQALLP